MGVSKAVKVCSINQSADVKRTPCGLQQAEQTWFLESSSCCWTSSICSLMCSISSVFSETLSSHCFSRSAFSSTSLKDKPSKSGLTRSPEESALKGPPPTCCSAPPAVPWTVPGSPSADGPPPGPAPAAGLWSAPGHRLLAAPPAAPRWSSRRALLEPFPFAAETPGLSPGDRQNDSTTAEHTSVEEGVPCFDSCVTKMKIEERAASVFMMLEDGSA